MIHEKTTRLSFIRGGFADLVRVGSRYRWRGRWYDESQDKPTDRLRFLSPLFDNRAIAVAYVREHWSDKVNTVDGAEEVQS